jgi:NAD(P)-dependent dehydrogenase (short-subunit alcohol dehydrogenase family)/acyl carrier protein
MFVDACGVGQALAQRLEAQGREVLQVTVADQFVQRAPGGYGLNPERAGDYRALMADLAANQKMPERIVHLWNLTAGAPASFELAQVTGLYSLLFLAQAFGAQSTGGTIAVDIISNHAQLVCDGEVSYPEKATLWGAARVVPQEYPYLVCRAIDVILPDSGSWQAARLTDQLLAELAHAGPAERTVAYRGSQRWTQTYERVQLPGSRTAPRLLRPGGVYLITGGLGGLGWVVADYLAQTVQAKLVLVGRAALPARQTWSEWLTLHPDDDPLSRQIRSVQALEAQGAQVLLFSADVARRDAMEDVVTQTIARFGALHGVFHAAGLVGENAFWPIQETGPEECRQHFRAKVEGLTVLEQVTEGKGLDFCLLFSSLATVLGGLGLAAYAAANSYMDGMAQHHNRASATPWISVNWDAWQLDGQAQQRRAAALMEFALTPAEGQAALGRILSSALSGQLVVSTGDLAARQAQWLTPGAESETQAAAAPDAATAQHPRPNLQTLYVAPRNTTEQAIAEIWQQVLGIESVGIHDSFFELGGTSLSGIQVIGKVSHAFNVHIPAVSLYEGPTVSALAQMISPDGDSPAAYEDSRSRGERRREKKLRRRQTEEG